VKLSADPSDFEKDIGSVTNRVENFASKMGQLGQGLTAAVSLPLAGAGIAAIKMASDFDFSLTMITSLVGIARNTVMDWRDEVIQMSVDTGRSARELADGLYYITSAGFKSAESLEILEASAKAAMIGMGETRLIAYAAVSAMNAYSSSNLDADTAVATLVATIREGNVMANTLAPTLGRVIPIASTMGVEFHEVGAALASMTLVGLNAEEAATALRQIMASLANPTAEARKQLEEMGISTDSLRQMMRDGLLPTLFYLRDTFQGNEEAIFKVFGNIRALTGVLNLVGDNATQAERIFKVLANTTGKDLVDAAEAGSEAFRVKFQKSLAELNTALLQLGYELLPIVIPAIQELARVVGEAVKDWKELPEAVRLVILGLGGLVIAAGPVMLMYSKLTKWLPMIASLFARQSIAIEGVTLSTAKLPLMARGWTAAFTTLGGAIGLVGAALAGWEIGRLLSDMTGLTEAASKMEAPLKSLADVTMEIPDRLNDTIMNVDRMAERFGTFGERVAATEAALFAQMEGDASRLLYWEDLLGLRAHENVTKHAAMRKEKERIAALAAQQAGKETDIMHIIGRMYDQERQRADDLYEDARKKVLSEQEVNEAIRAQLDLMNRLRNDGIGINQVVAQQGGKMEELLGYAKEYGTHMSLGAQDWVKVLREQGHNALADAIEQYDTLNKSVDLTPGKVIEMFSKVGEAGETTGEVLTGSLTKSFDAAQQRASEFATWIANNPLQWDVELIMPNLKDAMDDVDDGYYPPGGARKP
jgi:TP901 family phage tail tape measure protein